LSCQKEHYPWTPLILDSKKTKKATMVFFFSKKKAFVAFYIYYKLNLAETAFWRSIIIPN